MPDQSDPNAGADIQEIAEADVAAAKEALEQVRASGTVPLSEMKEPSDMASLGPAREEPRPEDGKPWAMIVPPHDGRGWAVGVKVVINGKQHGHIYDVEDEVTGFDDPIVADCKATFMDLFEPVATPSPPPEPKPLTFESRNGKPYLVGEWPEFARVTMDMVRDEPFMDVTVDDLLLVIDVANGTAKYEHAEDHGAGVHLFRLLESTLDQEPEATAPEAPIAPDPAPTSAVAVAPDGTQTPVQAPPSKPLPPTTPPPVVNGMRQQLDPNKKCPACGRFVSTGHRISCPLR